MSTIRKAKAAIKKVKELQAKVKKVADAVEHPLRTSGGQIGKRLGSKKRGEQIGSFLGKITGTGDYTLQSQRLSSTSIPTFLPSKRGVRVVHREYLGDVRASSTAGAFRLQSYPLNPGLFQTFPWLSSFAQQFDQWKPNGMVAFIKTLSSNYSGTTSLGTVIIATDYDVKDAPYASKIEMENSEFATSGNASQSITHAIECRKQETSNIYYTRSGAVPSDDNPRFFDLGNLQVATTGCVADQLVGELWISFDITLYKPQLFGSLGKNILFLQATFAGTGNTTPFLETGLTLTDTNLPVYPANSSDSYTSIYFNNDNAIVFPASLAGRTFNIEYICSGTSAATDAYEITYSNCAAGRNVTSSGSFATQGTSTYFIQIITVKLGTDPSSQSSVTYSTGTRPSSPALAYLNIYQIPNA